MSGSTAPFVHKLRRLRERPLLKQAAPESMSTPRHPARENSFTFLRMALALAVVVGHSFSLGGFGSDPVYHWSGSRMALHEIALQCFFILSGYLLTGSLTAQPSLTRFTLRRCFRILPGYWVSLLVTALVLTPAIFGYTHPTGFRYQSSLVVGEVNALSYLTRNALLFGGQVTIPPLFSTNPLSGIVNGSLWSIFFEACCYLALGLASLAGLLRRRNFVLGLFALLYLPCLIHAVFPIGVPPPTANWHRILLVAFHPAGPNVLLPFVAGVAAHFIVRQRPVWHARMFGIAALAFIAAIPLGAGRVFSPVVLPYLLLSLGEKLPCKNWERAGDFSYGTYIYAFVIQQCLVVLGVHHQGIAVFLATSLALSVLAGALSWFMIERPAIRMGDQLLAKIMGGKVAKVRPSENVRATLPIPAAN